MFDDNICISVVHSLTDSPFSLISPLTLSNHLLLSQPQVDLTFERFRFLAPCQRLRAIVCVLSAHLRRVLKSTCVCLRFREQCLRSEITSVSRVALVLLLRFVASNMDVNTPASKRSQLIGNTAIVRKRCVIHTNSTCVCWRLSVATFTQKRKDASFDLWPPLDVHLFRLHCTYISIVILPTQCSSLLTICPYQFRILSWTSIAISPTFGTSIPYYFIHCPVELCNFTYSTVFYCAFCNVPAPILPLSCTTSRSFSVTQHIFSSSSSNRSAR